MSCCQSWHQSATPSKAIMHRHSKAHPSIFTALMGSSSTDVTALQSVEDKVMYRDTIPLLAKAIGSPKVLVLGKGFIHDEMASDRECESKVYVGTNPARHKGPYPTPSLTRKRSPLDTRPAPTVLAPL
ncbi:hypothetical protein Tco_0676410 [Tanacetum coccineum]